MTKPVTSMTSREFNQDTGGAKKEATRGPVFITDRGRPSHVLLSFVDYQQLTEGAPRLVDVLCETPGVGDVDFEIPARRDRGEPATFD